MKVESRFQVGSPIERVWEALLDLERVAPCLPGARILERTGPDAYSFAMKVKVGPVQVEYLGDLRVLARDPAARRAVLEGKAREARGQGGASGQAELRLAEEGSATRGEVAAELQIRGRVATLGRGILQDVADKLCETFAANLAAMLAGSAEPAPPAPDPVGGAPSAPAPRAASPPASASAPPAPVAAGASRAPGAAPEALPALELLARVAAGRLARPGVLLTAAAGVFALGFLAGRCA
jgi:carbon monoxide dehydrogenase subunit G